MASRSKVVFRASGCFCGSSIQTLLHAEPLLITRVLHSPSVIFCFSVSSSWNLEMTIPNTEARLHDLSGVRLHSKRFPGNKAKRYQQMNWCPFFCLILCSRRSFFYSKLNITQLTRTDDNTSCASIKKGTPDYKRFSSTIFHCRRRDKSLLKQCFSRTEVTHCLLFI